MTRKAIQQDKLQRPVNAPAWARKLDANDFSGKKKELLLAAQTAAPSDNVNTSISGRGDHPAMIGNAGGDWGSAAASHLGDVGRNL